MISFLKILIFTTLIISFFSCQNHEQEKDIESKNKLQDSITIKKANPESDTNKVVIIKKTASLKQTSDEILKYFKSKNYSKIAQFIHPNFDLRFTPYTTIDTSLNVKLNKREFLNFINSPKKLYWGDYMGSGDSINLSFKVYIEKFIYNADYLNADQISLNKTLSKGSSIDNIKQIYPNDVYIEYHFKGLDKKNNGMDWCSLRMVFKKLDNKYYLISLIHDQWTI